MPFAACAALAVLPWRACVPLMKKDMTVAVLLQPRPMAAARPWQKRQDAALLPNEMMEPHVAREQLLLLTAAMAREGGTPPQRVLPSPPASYRQWEHYPKGDAIDPVSKARWFYHAHPPQQRDPGEHGHFHIFLPLSAFEGVEALAAPQKEKAAKVVHVAALSFGTDGLPSNWCATNQWVTEEYLFPAEPIIARLDQLDLDQAGEDRGIADVGRWLTLAITMSRFEITQLLRARDHALTQCDGPRDRKAEVLARQGFAL